MLAIEQLALRVNPIQLLLDRHLTIKSIRVDGGSVHLLRAEGALGLNLNLLLQRLGGPGKPAQTPPSKRKALGIAQDALQAVSVGVDDQQAPEVQDAFDLHPIRIEQIALELANLQVKGNTLAVDVQHCVGRYADHPLVLKQLCTGLQLTPDGMHLTKLVLQTKGSHIKGDIQLRYNNLSALAQFVDKVEIVAQLDEVVLAAEELGIFFPYFKQHPTVYTLKSRLVGHVSDFCLEDFQFRFGQEPSHLNGSIQLRGLPHCQAMLFDLQLNSGCLHAADLLPYVHKKHHEVLKQVRLCQVQGNFVGSPKDFVAQSSLVTGLGAITTNVAVAMDASWQHASYCGAIAADKLELGSLLGIRALQQLTMQGQIKGKGLGLATADFQLEADVHKLGFNNYEYKDIRTAGRFAQAFFQGHLAIGDPKLQLQAHTLIDWRGHSKEMYIKGVLDSASLQALGLTDKDIKLSTQIDLTLQGTSLDDFTTDAALTQFCFDLAGRTLQLDSLCVRNRSKGAYGTLAMTSDLFTIQAEGALQYTDLARDMQQFVQGYQQRLTFTKPTIPHYTAQPYTFTYKAHLEDLNPLLYVFMPDVYIAPHTTLAGSFASQEKAVTLRLHLAKADSLAFKQNSWINTQLAITASQTKDGKAIAATSRLTAEKQQWGAHNTTEDLLLDIAWRNDQLNFTTRLGRQEDLHQLHLQGSAVWQEEAIQARLAQADIKIAAVPWQLDTDNLITLAKSRIQFQNIVFSHAKQRISLEGILSPDLQEKLQIQLKDVDLSNFNAVLDKQLAGIVEGGVTLHGLLDNPWVDGNLNIHALAINDLLIGDLQAKTGWDNQDKQLSIGCQVTHVQRPIVHITGFYRPTKSPNSLQLAADFSNAQLAMLEPFVEKLFSQLGGEVSGRLHIQGSPTHPQITGHAHITHGALRINYLNTLYHYDGAITCTENAMQVNGLKLTDDQQGEAVLRGAIHHTGCKDFQLALAADVKDFKGLDTTHEDNEHFYGTGIVSGSMTLTGPVDRIAIDIKATTKPGTRIVIPMKQYGERMEEASYIRFVSAQSQKEDTVAQAHSVTLKGLALTIALAITPDAWTEIILNAATGDAIKGSGKGNLTIQVDTEGTLSMTGHYELTEGAYHFSIYEVIRRKFKILAGSSLTWYDKPYEGILHCQAAYEQRVALTPLLVANGTVARAQDTKKYPVQVILALQGTLVAPEPHFKVSFPEPPHNTDLQAAIHAFQDKAAADEHYLMNQVFSLIMLKMFFNDNLAKSSRGTLGRHVGELFSQQLSSFAARLDENLIIDTDIDFSDLDQGKLESFRLKLAYNFLGGRLRITREGAISTSANREMGTANLVGDWTLESMLTQDGRLRAKLYNKYVRSNSLVTDNTTAMAGGFSLLYVKSFDRWKELFSSNKKAQQKKVQQAAE